MVVSGPPRTISGMISSTWSAITPSAGLLSSFQLNDTPSICMTFANGSSIGLMLVLSLISDVESKSVAVAVPVTVTPELVVASFFVPE